MPQQPETKNNEAIKTIPQVGKKNSKKSNSIWIGIIGLVLLSYGLLKACSDNKDSTKVANHGNATQDQADANIQALKDKLAKEKLMDEARLQSLASQEGAGDTSLNNKVYLARINAPTTVYEAKNNTNMMAASTNTKSSVVEAQPGSNTNQAFIGKDYNSQFLNHASNNAPDVVEANRISHPDFTIVQGTLIPAVLETAINSDLPGMVRAHTSAPVYSYDGSKVLLPAGSLLVGQYTSSVVQGQNRVFIVWNRAVRPDAISAMLNSPGADTLGRAGQGANVVQTHFWSRFGEAALLSIIGAGASNIGVNSATQFNSAASYRMAMAQSFADSAQQSLQGTIAIQPTLHIYQGTAINIFVARDLSFYEVLHPQQPDDKPATTLPLTRTEISKLRALASS